LQRHDLAERGKHDWERTAGKAETDEHAGRQIEHRRARRMRHEYEAERV